METASSFPANTLRQLRNQTGSRGIADLLFAVVLGVAVSPRESHVWSLVDSFLQLFRQAPAMEALDCTRLGVLLAVAIARVSGDGGNDDDDDGDDGDDGGDKVVSDGNDKVVDSGGGNDDDDDDDDDDGDDGGDKVVSDGNDKVVDSGGEKVDDDDGDDGGHRYVGGNKNSPVGDDGHEMNNSNNHETINHDMNNDHTINNHNINNHNNNHEIPHNTPHTTISPKIHTQFIEHTFVALEQIMDETADKTTLDQRSTLLAAMGNQVLFPAVIHPSVPSRRFRDFFWHSASWRFKSIIPSHPMKPPP